MTSIVQVGELFATALFFKSTNVKGFSFFNITLSTHFRSIVVIKSVMCAYISST